MLLCGISSKRAFPLTAAVFQMPAVEMMVIILGLLRSKVIHPGWLSSIAGCITRDTSCTPLPPFGSGCLSPGRVYMCCCNLGLSSSLGKAVFLQTSRNDLHTFPTAPMHTDGLTKHAETHLPWYYCKQMHFRACFAPTQTMLSDQHDISSREGGCRDI